MESSKIKRIKLDSPLYNKETIDPLYFKNVMTQKINKKLDIILSQEITKKKKIIYDLFQNNFGPNFLGKKPESLNNFESLFGKYFFSANSKFLKEYFPKIYKKIFHEKKIDLEKIKTKINIGPMMYLTLRKHLVSNKSSISDKLLYISKNFTRKEEKDLVYNLYFKFKKNAEKRKIYKSNKKYSSERSINFGGLSRVNNIKCKRKLNNDNSNSKNDNSYKKNIKKVIFNIETENDENNKNLKDNSEKFSKTQKNFFGFRNKNLEKFRASLTKNKNKDKNSDKLSSIMLNINSKDSNINQNKYNKYYLSNPFYIYNSNKHYRNINKNKISKSEYNTISQDNYISSSLKPSQPNLFLQNSNLKNTLDQGNSIFNTFTNSTSPKNRTRTLSSVKNIKLTPNIKKQINIKIIPNKFSKKEDTIEKDNSKSISLSVEEIDNKNDKNTISLKTQPHKKHHFSFDEKNSFEKFFKRKTKKFKNRINSEVKILNNYTNKCNKKLIKLIDQNFIINSKEKQKIKTKNVNFDITKLLLDDKRPKILFKKYAKSFNTIKPIFNKTINDLQKFDKRNKYLGKKYFIQNINKMPTELALFFIGEFFKTKHIKFSLKEFTRKREEKKLEDEENNLRKLRIKSKNHLFRLKQFEYMLNKKN